MLNDQKVEVERMQFCVVKWPVVWIDSAFPMVIDPRQRFKWSPIQHFGCLVDTMFQRFRRAETKYNKVFLGAPLDLWLPRRLWWGTVEGEC